MKSGIIEKNQDSNWKRGRRRKALVEVGVPKAECLEVGLAGVFGDEGDGCCCFRLSVR